MMKRDLAIYGAGGFGKEIACLVKKINEREDIWNLIGFFDDGKKCGDSISHFGNVLGDIKTLNQWDTELNVVLAIGNHAVLKDIVKKIINPFIKFPNIISPVVNINDPDTFDIGIGNIIQSNCTMSCDVSIGDFNILNGAVVLGHDVKVGSFNTIMSGVRVSGEVTIGDDNFFGVSSIVLQQLHIGCGVRLSAGSVMVTRPKDGKLYIGNPARKCEL